MPAAATYPLRRAVLRGGDPEAEVRYEGDDLPTAVHLVALDGADAVVACATLFPAPTERFGPNAWRLRGMAVAPSLQGTGVGRELLDEAVRRVRAEGADVIWADGRDTALGFYEREGWRVEGDGYDVPVGTGTIPHHLVVLELA